MKKFLISCLLLFSLFLLLVGCSFDNRRGAVIVEIRREVNGKFCMYASKYDLEFIDDCGKFQIGDTVVIQKVN